MPNKPNKPEYLNSFRCCPYCACEAYTVQEVRTTTQITVNHGLFREEAMIKSLSGNTVNIIDEHISVYCANCLKMICKTEREEDFNGEVTKGAINRKEEGKPRKCKPNLSLKDMTGAFDEWNR